MKFKINNSEYTIEEVSEAVLNYEVENNHSLGIINYKEQKIMLLEGQANIIKTLKHELTHAWLYEYGHNKNSYSYEDVCEIVASSNDFINEVVEQYKNKETITYTSVDGEERTEEVEEDE